MAGDHGTPWVTGNPDAEPIPPWIKPERQVTVADVSYPESWYRTAAGETGEQLKMKKLPEEIAREEAAKAEAREVAASVLAVLAAEVVGPSGE